MFKIFNNNIKYDYYINYITSLNLNSILIYLYYLFIYFYIIFK